MSKAIVPADYADFLTGLKERIRSAQITAARAVNRELILLYWDIGHAIVEKQQMARWGDAVVERLSADLRAEFPDMRGFSARNLRDMKRMWQAYSAPEFWRQAVAVFSDDIGDDQIWRQAVAKLASTNKKMSEILEQSVPENEFLRQLVAEIPWGHHLLILNNLKDPAARLYYLRATVQFGWSRRVLQNQIKGKAYERARKEKKTHNFPLALPEHLAEQADEMMKSRYNLEFLGIGRAMKERSFCREAATALSRGREPADGILPAAKRCQQVAAGVSPQNRCTQSTIEPRSGGSNAPVTTSCRRYAARPRFGHPVLRLTPQAICCCRFAALTNAVRRALPASKEDH